MNDPIEPGSRRLGGYDGVELWTLRAWGTRSVAERVVASLHERLHHELQNTTLWGLITRFADDFRSDPRFGVTGALIFWTGVGRSQLVHETYATTLAVGVDAEYVALLDENPDQRAHYERGLSLIGPDEASWATDRYVIDAALRACMAAPGLAGLAASMPRVRLSALDTADLRPDLRLRRLLGIDLRPLREAVGTPVGSISDVERVHDACAEHLTRRGLPTLDTAGQRAAIVALVEAVRAELPNLEISIDTDRDDPVADDLGELQRERIELHPSPLPVAVVTLEASAARPIDFVRDHATLGNHVLIVWVRADLLARQFVRPGPLDDTGGHVLAVQAAGEDDAGEVVVRLAVAEGIEDPAVLGRAFRRVGVLYLTTMASLLDASASARFSGDETLYVLVDQPILEQLRHTLGRGAVVAWSRFSIGGDRDLRGFAHVVDELPGLVFLHVTAEVGGYALLRWLHAREGAGVRHDPGVVRNHRDEIDAIVGHIVAAWWTLDQIGARRA